MEALLKVDFWVDFGFSVLRMSTPIIYCAMGALISRQAGAMNIALEGIMLTSALTGVVVSAFTQNLFLGLLGAIAGGLLISAVMSYMNLAIRANLMLTGIALNTMASGGTVFVLYLICGDKGASHSLQSLVVPNFDIPLIKDIPIVGQIFSGQNILTYAAYLIVVLTYFLVFRSKIGLRIRAVGENPDAAESVGINVVMIRFRAFLLSGAFAALGGAFMSMGYLSFFSRDMMAGRGFIGISAMNLANGTAFASMIASVAFGAADSFAIVMQGLRIPPEFVQMLPYLATVIGLVFFSASGKRKADRKRKGS